MEHNIRMPWKRHLQTARSENPRGWSGWIRRKGAVGFRRHPALMIEEDLDHLGTVHEEVSNRKKR